jgi:hypothetical protein
MVTPVLKGTITDGRIAWQDEEKLRMHLASFVDEQEIEVIVRKARSKRTIKQNSYYWAAVLEIISKETGNSVNDLHDFFKAKFLQKQTNIFGKTYTVVRSTTDLNTKEFTEYIRQIKVFAAGELDIFVPDADSAELPNYF